MDHPDITRALRYGYPTIKQEKDPDPYDQLEYEDEYNKEMEGLACKQSD